MRITTHGTNHIDKEYLKEKGIKLYNTPLQSYDVAQGVMTYVLVFATNWLKLID
ncbi:MAG: hypothetical protein QXR09_01505 [Candidatus Aenigmatarchaeota archaeon]